MYARLVSFNFGPGQQHAAETLAEDLGPLIRSQPGCSSATFFGDDTDGEYGIFVLWDTQAQANDAAVIVSPRLEQHLAGKVKGKLSARLFEVIGSR
jgi:hypothetical protein